MAIFEKVDCVMVKVDNLAKGMDFYHRALGHEILWKTETAAGLKFPNSNAELVLSTENGPEVDLKVQDTREAFDQLVRAGAKPIARPFEIAIGYCAVLEDPWGNTITILDTAKGLLKVDSQKNVVGTVSDSDPFFKGMIVEESLLDPTLINRFAVEKVQISTPVHWHIYTVFVKEQLIDECQHHLKDGPWYMHFWQSDSVVVVFKNKLFRLSTYDEEAWAQVKTYARSIGISEEQLDFVMAPTA